MHLFICMWTAYCQVNNPIFPQPIYFLKSIFTPIQQIHHRPQLSLDHFFKHLIRIHRI